MPSHRVTQVIDFAHHARVVKGLKPPAPGKPETILLIGSDHRDDFTDYGQSKTATAAYWISNTLDNAISNPAMIAMGAELTRYRHPTH